MSQIVTAVDAEIGTTQAKLREANAAVVELEERLVGLDQIRQAAVQLNGGGHRADG